MQIIGQKKLYFESKSSSYVTRTTPLEAASLTASELPASPKNFSDEKQKVQSKGEITMESIREQLAKFSQAFETRTNKDGEEYWCLKSKEKDIYHNLVRDIHSVEMLPDDYRFSIISKISDELVHNLPWSEIETITEFEEKAEELRHECVDGLVDISVHGLLRWASSHSQRVQMVDEASEIYGRPDNLVRQLRVGQYHEIDEIYARFIKYFAEFRKE